VHEENGSELPAPDEGAGMLQHRIEAHVEGHGVDEPACLREADELGGLGAGHRQRLLADDMLAGQERRARRRVVMHVARSDVYDVDLGIADEVAIVGVRPGHGKRGGLAFRRGLAAGGHGHDLDVAQPPQGLDVHRTDEPGADDADAYRDANGVRHARLPQRSLAMNCRR